MSGVAEPLFSRSQLDDRVTELAREMESWFGEDGLPPILIAVLKGSTMFLADLFRRISRDVSVDFMSISAYSARPGSGVVQILKDVESDLTGRDVVIVEDIVDTGLTLNYLRRSLGARHPRTLRAVTLLDKSVRRIVPVELELSGFDTPDVFVVGYGLDFQGLYRNVPDILAVRDVARLVNDPALLVGELYRR